MRNPRLVYRVILKILFLSAFLLLLWVMMRSLFVGSNDPHTKNTQQETQTVTLDISKMQKGEIKKANWQGVEVAVLYRKTPISLQTDNRARQAHPSLNPTTRSIKPDYFVYINKGNSGNCPLFYANDTFKDICSSTLFDNAGREKTRQQKGHKIQIPPHYFNNNQLIIGQWQKLWIDDSLQPA